jgi:predicted TIM-barrel fold metal-dependent hydrolase
MPLNVRVLAAALLCLFAGTHAAAQRVAAPAKASGPLARVTERAGIVPRVDHHQHIVGPRAAIPWPALAPAPALPPELSRVISERNRVMGTQDVGDLYTETAQVLDVEEESQPWVRGAEAVRRLVGSYDRTTRFVPQSFAAGDAVAYVTGVAVTPGQPETRMNFVLGLRKDDRGVWRIESEQATPIPPPPFVKPLTADQLIRDMDETGIQRAVVLSVAYFFGSPSRTWPGDEYENVRAENDWVAAQAARYPERLVAFCGVSPIKDYAEREVRRCATELRMKGLKLHLRSSRVNVLNPEHLEKLRRIFRVANELRLPIVIHTHVRPYGREQAEVFLKELLPAAPDVVVQIAHLWGGNEFVPAALDVFADAVAAKDPRTKNLYFDLTEVEPAAEFSGDPGGTMQAITQRIRRIGLNRILYGSDAAATADAPPTALRWARLRRALPLTNEELRVVANNVAPYMR